MRRIIVAAAAAIALIAPGAAAQPCGDAGTAEVQYVAPAPGDAELVAGLSVAFMFALSPETFPADDIASKSDACRRGEFTANGRTFQLFGNETDTPPRWAIGPDRRRIVYLAMAPDPAEALQAARTRATQISLTKPPTYVLAVTDGHRRRIYQVSNAIPADDRLMTSMRDALEGRLPLMATFDAKSGETEFED